MTDIKEINNARRMLEVIYRLADEPNDSAMSDIRFFARAGVIQLNRALAKPTKKKTQLRILASA